MTTEIISSQFFNQSQSWNYETIVRSAALKLRVHIRRNAYDDQSHIRGFVLDPVALKWNTLVDRPIGSGACSDVSYTSVESKADRPAFERDAAGVLAELLEIVG